VCGCLGCGALAFWASSAQTSSVSSFIHRAVRRRAFRESAGGLAKKTRDRDKKCVLLTLFLAWTRAVMLTPLFDLCFLSAVSLATSAGATAPLQSSDEAPPVVPAATTTPADTSEQPDNSQPRLVLDQRVERLSAEPQSLPFTICFHAAGAAPHCVEALGGRDLEQPIASDSLIELRLPPLADVRVRLLDDSHRLVPSSDYFTSDHDQGRYLIQPESPLVPGTKHFVRVDGLVEALPTAVDGAQYRSVRVSFVTSGEKPPKEPRSKKKKKKKQSRRR